MHRKLVTLAGCLLAVVFATGWLRAQAPAAQPAATPGVRERTLFYVAAPGNGPNLEDGGYGIMVFDRNANWKFLKRIPLWDYPAWLGPGDFRGISAHVATSRLYVSHHRGVAAFDLRTDKMLWHTDSLNTGLFDNGDCCDNSHITMDGKTIVVGSRRRQDRWWVLDANTGKITGEIPSPETKGPHNLVMNLDGTRMYLGPTANGIFSVLDASTLKIIGTVGATTGDTRTFTINGAGTRLYATMTSLLGFEILDIPSRKMIERVEVPGFRWEGRRYGHGTPSHGVALSPDEKEVWVADGVEGQHYMHVFDNTVTPKKLIANVPTRRNVVWIIFSIDGQYVYNSNGEIFEAATKKQVGQLLNEHGQMAGSEKSLEVVFQGDKVVRVGERGGMGQVRSTGTSNQQ